VNTSTGDSHWVFESSDQSTRPHNATDSRFFWISLYAQPVAWVALAIVAILKFEFIWLTLVGTLLRSSLLVNGFGLMGSLWAYSGMISDCVDAFNNEYTGVFAVRQVWPGFKFGRIRAGFGWAGEEYCGRTHEFMVPRQ
jgi:hypothetical protein